MCEPATLTTLALAASAGSGVLGAVSAINQGKAAEQVGRNNATMAEYAAQDAQRRGEEEAMQVQRRGAALKSSQRVALAANGLDLSYGTAADMLDQTDFFTQSDAATARTNARKDAWSARVGGANALAEGKAAKSNSQLAAAGSLLGAAGTVAGKWYDYKKT